MGQSGRGRQRGVLMAAVALLVGALGGLTPADASAHAGLASSDPLAGATLGAAPTEVRLSFSEPPEPSLSEVTVSGSDGAALEGGLPEAAPGDPLSLAVPLPNLGRGVYTVGYRAISTVDGHATEGTFAFGVGVMPTSLSTATTTGTPAGSAFEWLARWILLVGLITLIGAGSAGAARFGGTTNSDLALGAVGFGLSLLGLVLLTEAQRSLADASIGALLDTPVGQSLTLRAVAIGGAGAALLLAWRAPQLRREALSVAAIGALSAIAVHVEAGHAGAGSWPVAMTVPLQVAHFAAAGVWFGGLAALLLGIRGAASAEKASAVRRFAVVASGALLIVIVTGTVRAIDELSSWSDLIDSGYGRAVLAKLALILFIVALAARNRRRSVPAATKDLRPLRRTSRTELTLGITALAVAALLGTLAPSVTGQPQPAALPGLSASGADSGSTVQVELTVASDQPGANRFVARVEDYDSGESVDAERVSLRFKPVDDPGIKPTSLALSAGPDGSYDGSGPNLAFDGRWEVVVLIGRDSDSVEVPLELDLPIPEQFISVNRQPDAPPEYTLQTTTGYIRITPDPERAGPSRVYVTGFTRFEDVAKIEQLVLTVAAGEGSARQSPVRRLGPGRFVAHLDLEAGPSTLFVIARTRDGTRMRGAFELDIPST